MSVTVFGPGDHKLLWIAYRLEQLPSGWVLPEGLEPSEFRDTMESFIVDHHDYAWVVRHEETPLAIVFGRDTTGGIFAGDIVWFPKATRRQRMEVGVAFFDTLRAEASILVTTAYSGRALYEKLRDWRILRRVGTLYDADGGRMPLYQTIAKRSEK